MRDAVLDDAFGDPDQDTVRAVPRVELGAGQTAGQQRDDDDRDQDDRLPVEESATASLLDCGRLRLGSREPAAVAPAGGGGGGPPAGGWGGPRRVAGRWAAGARRPELLGRRRIGRPIPRTDLFGRRFRRSAGARKPSRRGVGCGSPYPADQAARGVAAASSPARFCLISGHMAGNADLAGRDDTPNPATVVRQASR